MRTVKNKAEGYKRNYYVGLVHYPVYNKHRQVINTSITNMDVHDIARTCCSYGVRNYILINPLSSQKDLYKKIIKFWQSELGRNYQPDRAEALRKTVFLSSIDEGRKYIENQEKAYPVVVTTTANHKKDQIEYDSLNDIIDEDKPILILFGTGYGLSERIHLESDYILKPIESYSEYNHLSVRSAVAIVLDRLIPKNKGGDDGYSTSCKQRTA